MTWKEHTDLGFTLQIVFPITMFGGAIASGRLLRLMANRSGGSMKSLLAAPSLYMLVVVFVMDFVLDQLWEGVWILTLAVFALTWPITYLSFRLGRSAPASDPNAPPTCPKCEYNLTGNVSGICPECGTPIATQSPQPSKT
jgi:hypothetical protein